MDSELWTHFNPVSRRNLELLHQQARTRLAHYADAEPLFHFVPGRIEVAGKHTDYAGGHSLVCATELGFLAGIVPSEENRLEIGLSGSSDTFSCDLEGAFHGVVRDWGIYARAVIERIINNFGVLDRGATVWLSSNLPQSAGLSSSSALITALFLSLDALYNLSSSRTYQENIKSRLDLAQYLGAIENGTDFRELKGASGVGTRGGCQDHVAILCSQPGFISHITYNPLQVNSHIALKEDWVFVVADSGIAASKTGNAQGRYNRAADLARQAVHIWNEAWETTVVDLDELIHAPVFSMDRFQDIVRAGKYVEEEDLIFRVLHFCKERLQFVPEMKAGIASENRLELFMLSAQAQDAASRLLQNQTPETDFLASAALDSGAIAATAFGAGFGGSVWALSESASAETFLASWQEAYTASFPEAAARAGYFISAPGPAAMRL